MVQRMAYEWHTYEFLFTIIAWRTQISQCQKHTSICDDGRYFHKRQIAGCFCFKLDIMILDPLTVGTPKA